MDDAVTLDAPAVADREAAFAAFVAAHRERAVSLAWRLCGGDGAAAEDVAQEAFLAAHRALPGFRGDAALATWFYRILVRQARRHRRRQALRAALHWPWGDGATRPAPGDAPLARRIGAALDRLSRGQREAFVLVHLEGFTITEAAAALGKAPGTLKSHLHRALVQLRAELGELRDDGDRGGAS